MPENEEKEEFTSLAEQVKTGIEGLRKEIVNTLESERKTNEEILKNKAEGKAVSELQAKLEKLEKAHDEATKAFDKEVADLKMSASAKDSNGAEAEVKSDFFSVLRTGNYNGLDEGRKNRLAEVICKQIATCEKETKSIDQVKSMLSGIDTSGGVLVVPPMLEASILRFLTESVALYDMAGKTSISGPVYQRDARITRAGALWEGENDDWGNTDTSKYGRIEINVHKLIATPTISRDLLEDSRLNMEAEIMDFTQEAFRDKLSLASVLGTGNRQPKGLLTVDTEKQTKAADTYGKLGYAVTGNANGFIARSADNNPADCLIDLQGILKSGYQNRAVWLMNRVTGSTIRKWKDSDGNYLWQPSLTAGVPPMLLGFPVRYDSNMPTAGESTKYPFPIAFGDFNTAMLIINRRGLTVIRDMTSKPGHVKFLIDLRIGMGLRNFEAVKLLKVSA